MKTHVLLAALLSISILTSAQDSTKTVFHAGKHDLLVNPINSMVESALNASYEHILTKDYGVGIDVFVGIASFARANVQFSPFARMYMGRHRANGFFLEAFLPITIGEEFAEQFGHPDLRHTSIGLGAGLGGKWVLPKGIVLEVSGGLGQKLSYKGSGIDSNDANAGGDARASTR